MRSARTIWRRLLITAAIAPLGLLASPAFAGMPNIRLTDIASMRVQTMSFFLLVLLLSALAIQLIWNFLRRDFIRLPRLSYPRSLAVVSLWGLLFLLVLTMISGARELMTPGAWARVGFTYRLSGEAAPNDLAILDEVESQRLPRMRALKAALWEHASKHEGVLPEDQDGSLIPPEIWETSDPSAIKFSYIAGQRIDADADQIIAYEPAIFPSPRYVLKADGSIGQMPDYEIRRTLAARQP